MSWRITVTTGLEPSAEMNSRRRESSELLRLCVQLSQGQLVAGTLATRPMNTRWALSNNLWLSDLAMWATQALRSEKLHTAERSGKPLREIHPHITDRMAPFWSSSSVIAMAQGWHLSIIETVTNPGPTLLYSKWRRVSGKYRQCLAGAFFLHRLSFHRSQDGHRWPIRIRGGYQCLLAHPLHYLLAPLRSQASTKAYIFLNSRDTWLGFWNAEWIWFWWRGRRRGIQQGSTDSVSKGPC